jgi:hypothetical protein
MMSTRFNSVYLTIIAVAVAFAPRAAFAQSVVDQYNLLGDINWAIHSSSDIGQVFMVDTGGQLTGIELGLGRCETPTDPMVLEILTTSGGVPQPAPVLASVAIPNTSIPLIPPPTDLVLGTVTGTYVDLTGFGITVQSGVQYAFRLSTAGGNCYAVRGDTAANYSGGQRFTNWTLQTSDLIFKTFNEEQVISPVPTMSVWGLGIFAGLLGFFGIRRKMQQTQLT